MFELISLCVYLLVLVGSLILTIIISWGQTEAGSDIECALDDSFQYVKPTGGKRADILSWLEGISLACSIICGKKIICLLSCLRYQAKQTSCWASHYKRHRTLISACSSAAAAKSLQLCPTLGWLRNFPQTHPSHPPALNALQVC